MRSKRFSQKGGGGGLLLVLSSIPFVLTACDGGVEAGHLIEDLPVLELQEELRLGSATDPELGFSQIGGVAVDRDGLMYLLERRDRQVRVYDRQGTRLRTIGRPGPGPGEFQAATGIGIIDDTLWVRDAPTRRFSLFATSGELLGTFSVAPRSVEVLPGFEFFLSASKLRSDGLISTSYAFPVVGDPPGDTAWIPHLLLDRAGVLVDTLWRERWSYPVSREVRVGAGNATVPPAPSSHPLYQEALGGWYMVEREPATNPSASFAVTRFTLAGDTVYRREFAYRPVSFPEAAIDELVAPYLRTLTTLVSGPDGSVQEITIRDFSADSAEAAAVVRSAMVLPPYQPPVVAGRVGEDDVLWLRLHDNGGQTFRWLLVAPDGEPMGAIDLPRRAIVHWSSGAEMWVELPDEYDVPWMIRYRILD